MNEELIVVDEETMTLINTETGEVVGVKDTPPEDAADVDLATWLGERRDWHKGKLSGLKAELASRMETLTRIYGPQINRHEASMKFLDFRYGPMLFDLAKRIIGDGKKRSTVIGLLLLKIRTTRASIDVVDNDKAVGYFKGLLDVWEAKLLKIADKISATAPDEDIQALLEKENEAKIQVAKLRAVINVKESIYKSEIPEDLKREFTDENLEDTGIKANLGGDEYLEIE
jgi:hypothetical protein